MECSLYVSPVKELAAFFEKSRDDWKATCQAPRERHKLLGNPVRAIEKSRQWCRGLADGIVTEPVLRSLETRRRNEAERDQELAREFLIRRADRLLFGTDFQMNRQTMPQFELLDSFNLPDDVQRKHFRDNAVKM